MKVQLQLHHEPRHTSLGVHVRMTDAACVGQPSEKSNLLHKNSIADCEHFDKEVYDGERMHLLARRETA